jgi:hypothetical protein
MSEVVLMRTLTRKSIIGFGAYRDLSIQNLLDTRQHRALLEIYYFFRNIDFMPDIKEELFIIGERNIDKKLAHDKERYQTIYYRYINLCLGDIINRETEKIGKQKMLGLRQRNHKINKAIQKSNELALNKTIYSKGAQQRKNQW